MTDDYNISLFINEDPGISLSVDEEHVEMSVDPVTIRYVDIDNIPSASANHAGVVKIGNNLKIEQGVLSVDTADAAETDNSKPITSAAVKTEIGNIEVLLSSI